MNFLKIVLLCSLLLLIITNYKSEIYWNNKFIDQYLIYYVISIILIFLSFSAFFVKQKHKEYFIIIIITFIISLYTFEAYLFARLHFVNQISEIQNIKYDTRTRLEVFKDLKKNDSNVKIQVSPYNYLHKNLNIFPLSGVSNSKTLYCNENGYYFIFQSDRYGFNNPNFEWDSEEIEYLLVGDSFTMGACVNRPNDISSILRSLSNKSVLNLGYGGNGPLVEFATLKEYFQPGVKKVLWLYYEGNDLLDLEDEFKDRTLHNYVIDENFNQDLKNRQQDINKLANLKIEEALNDINYFKLSNEIEKNRLIKINENKKVKEKLKKQQINKYILIKNETLNLKIIKFSKLYYLQKYLSAKYLNYLKKEELIDHKNTYIEQLPELKKILRLANDFLKKNNTELYFVFLPEFSRYKKNYIGQTKYDSSVEKIVKDLGIPFIDMHRNVFLKENDPKNLFPFKLSGHYNEDGYRKIAENIYKITKN